MMSRAMLIIAQNLPDCIKHVGSLLPGQPDSFSPRRVTGVIAHVYTRILSSDMRDVQEKPQKSIGIL